MSHIEYMLKDAEPYVTGVRIGRDFQAEVPEWSGPTSRCAYLCKALVLTFALIKRITYFF